MENEIKTILSNSSLSYRPLSCDICTDCPNLHSSVALGRNVCYIVGAVLMNDNNDILLIQEAKQSCKGSWYLPAGRVEPNETLVDAVKREVQEEAGLLFYPTGLICVEENSGRWMRFIFSGIVTGGHLKTIDKADAESLQAAWFNDVEGVKLRSRDILQIIQIAKSYYNELKLRLEHRKLTILPVLSSHRILFLRAFIVTTSNDNVVHVLQNNCSSTNDAYFPVSCFPCHQTTAQTLQDILKKYLSDGCVDNWDLDHPELLCIEHNGLSKDGNDGLCLTVLSNLRHKDLDVNVGLPSIKEKQAQWCKLCYSTESLKFSSAVEQAKLCVPIITHNR